MKDKNEWKARLRDAEEKLISEEQSPLDQGIGGWLILVGIGICLGPFLQSYYLYQDLAGVFDPTLSMTIQMIPPLKVDLIIAFVSDILLFALICLLPFLFFTKKRLFTKVYIFALVYALLLPVSSACLAYVVGQVYVGNPFVFSEMLEGIDKKEFIRSAVKCCIWIPYMCCSSRVKQTFVR